MAYTGNDTCAGMKHMTRGTLKMNEPMASHTSWRVGGCADRYFIPADLEDLQEFLRSQADDEDFTWLGLGSNMLVRDGGIRGTVISLSGVIDEMKWLNKSLTKIGAGVTCAKAARFLATNGLTGGEFLAGIPGTIGGALAMNAGAFGSEIWDIVSEAETINRKGTISRRTGADLEIAYRHVNVPDNEWFISGTFSLEPDKKSTALHEMKALLRKRNQSQPTNRFTCGSVFRNPEHDFAGRLIEQAGLKSFSIGGACVSDKHANFIINTGTATAHDIESLISHIKTKIKREFNVELVLEVKIVGEHPDAVN